MYDLKIASPLIFGDETANTLAHSDHLASLLVKMILHFKKKIKSFENFSIHNRNIPFTKRDKSDKIKKIEMRNSYFEMKKSIQRDNRSRLRQSPRLSSNL